MATFKRADGVVVEKKLLLERVDVGYYDATGVLIYAPPFPGPCAICREQLTDEKQVANVNPKWTNPDKTLAPLALFFRVHQECGKECIDRDVDALCAQALLIGDRIARARLKMQS